MRARLLCISDTFLRIVLGGVVSPQPLIQYVNHLSPEINKHQRQSPHRHVAGSPLTPIEVEDSHRWQLMGADGGPGARRKRLLSFHSKLYLMASSPSAPHECQPLGLIRWSLCR